MAKLLFLTLKMIHQLSWISTSPSFNWIRKCVWKYWTRKYVWKCWTRNCAWKTFMLGGKALFTENCSNNGFCHFILSLIVDN